MTEEGAAKLKVEPLDHKKHDRAAFSCGKTSVDNFLKNTARKHDAADYTKTWVVVGENEQHILGFYSINSHSVRVEELPKSEAKGAPNHGDIPAAYISVFGVSKEAQGKGIGTVLLANCLKRILAIADDIGIRVIILDVLNDEDVERRKSFYERVGFISFPSNTLRMFLPVDVVRKIYNKK